MSSHFQISPEMFSHIQVWALGHSQSGPKAFPLFLDCVLRVVVLLEDEPLPQTKERSTLEQVAINDVFVHCCIHLSLNFD